MKKALFCLLLAYPFFSMGQNTKNKIIQLDDSSYRLSPGVVTYFTDSLAANPTIEDLLKNRGNFQPEKEIAIHYSGFYWIKFDLMCMENAPAGWIMSFRNQDYLEVYIDSTGGNEALYTPIPKRAGMLVPAYQKDYTSALARRPGVQISLMPDKKYTFYIKLKTIGNIRIYRKTDYSLLYSNYLIERNLTQGLFQGIMLVLALYNFLIFVMNREKIYLYYTSYLFMNSLVFMLYFEFIIPEWLADYPIVNLLIIGLSNFPTFFYARFGLAFNDTKYNSPRWYRILYFTCRIVALSSFFYTAVLVAGYLFPSDNPLWLSIEGFASLLDVLIVYPVSLLLLAYTFSLFFVESRYKSFFIMGSLALVGTFAFTIINPNLGSVGIIIGWSRFDNWYLLEAAIVVEILCFSMGLGYRMKINEEEKRKAQEDVLQKTMENETILLEQNHVLEERIQERTQELQTMNEELNSMVEELSVTMEVLDNQKKTIEAINRKTTSSISYALSIQTAILPPEGYLHAHLKEYALVYRPRDIVSGDFYWLHASGDSLLVAVADCTGHGVAGAFTSLIGMDILKDLLKEQAGRADQLKPSQIISYLDSEINSRLKQDERQSFKEGMDIAVCSIQKSGGGTFSVGFAGAKRPLYYKKKGDSSFQKVSGDRRSVGSGISGRGVFTDHRMEFHEGDILYLSTDGFEDQNSPERKKFGEGRLIGLLNSICSKEMGEQKKILGQLLDDHQRGADQRDDITLLGFRL